MEEVYRRSEQVLEIGFNAGVGQCRDKGVEDIGEGASDRVLVGQGARIRFVLMRMIAMDLQFVDDAIGDRLNVGVLVAMAAAPWMAAFEAIRRRTGPSFYCQAQRRGRSGAEEGRGSLELCVFPVRCVACSAAVASAV